MIRNLTALALVALGLATAAPARALGLAPGGLTITTSPLAGQLELIDVVQGTPAGGVYLSGTVNPDSDSFVFRLTVDPGSEPFFVAADLFDICGGCTGLEGFGGLGTIPGADTDVTGLKHPPHVHNFVPTVGSFFPPGTTTDPFWVSVTAGDAELGEEILIVGFFAGEFGTESVVLGSFTVVPEPGSAALLGLGLAGLGLRPSGRRARGRSCGRRGRRCGWPRRRPF